MEIFMAETIRLDQTDSEYLLYISAWLWCINRKEGATQPSVMVD